MNLQKLLSFVVVLCDFLKWFLFIIIFISRPDKVRNSQQLFLVFFHIDQYFNVVNAEISSSF